jgi:hypothetical protein
LVSAVAHAISPVKSAPTPGMYPGMYNEAAREEDDTTEPGPEADGFQRPFVPRTRSQAGRIASVRPVAVVDSG